MAYTETTTTSYGSRLGGSFKGIVAGFVMLALASAMLWWNEANFVDTRDALAETQAATQELGDIAKLNAAMNGKVVHAQGRAQTKDTLADSVLGVSANAIRLVREVEYFQWKEKSETKTQKKLGGGEEKVTTYTYEQGWTKSPVDSTRFRDPAAQKNNANKTLLTLPDETQYAKNVTFGAYQLPDFFIRSISGLEPVSAKPSEAFTKKFNDEHNAMLPAAVRQMLPGAPTPLVRQPMPSMPTPLVRPVQQGANPMQPALPMAQKFQWVHASSGTVYLGKNPSAPAVGDVRITYKVAPASADVSLVAKLNGATFEPYYASNGQTVKMLSMGSKSVQAMFGTANKGNSTMTWILRVVGVILCVAAIKVILAPLAVLASVIPFLGSIVGGGTGLVAGLVGTAWALVVMSLAWLAARPLVAGALLAAAAVLVALIFVVRRKAAKPAASA